MAKAAKDWKSFTVKFEYVKDTPGTHRFQEVGDKDNHKIGGLYVKKGAIPEGVKTLSVTVTTE